SGHVGPAVDGADPVDAHRRPDLRVRMPRRQSRNGQHARRSARSRKGGKMKSTTSAPLSDGAVVTLLACAVLLLGAVPATAHHAFAAEFDVKRPIKLRGTVVKMEWINPHSWIHLEVKGANGRSVIWMIEGGSPNALLRLGFNETSLPRGSEIVVEGFQAKDGTNEGVGQFIGIADGRKLFLGGSHPCAKGEG